MFAAPDTIAGPARVALPYGLFSVVNLNAEEGRWENGVQWEPLTCAPASGVEAACVDPIGVPKTFASSGGVDSATPFTVVGSYKCGPIGHDLNYAKQRAVDHLLTREEARAEQAFWTGDLNNTPNLVGATDVHSAGAVNPVLALGLLEQAIATGYGSLGVIHVTRSAATTLLGAFLLQSSGGRLTTLLGTPVVAGAGYPGTSPAGAAPAAGTSWAYATPAIIGYRSDITEGGNRTGDLLDRGTNDLYGLAERNYLLAFDDCEVAAVRMTLGCCTP